MFSSEKCGAICFLSLCIVGSLFISQIGYGSSEGFHEGVRTAKDNNKDIKQINDNVGNIANDIDNIKKHIKNSHNNK